MLEAYCSLELKNVLPLLAKNFKFETFPKIPEHPDETKDKHFAKYGKILALFTELEVRGRSRKIALKLAGLYPPNRPSFTR